jgi:SulP family sulfate permease
MDKMESKHMQTGFAKVLKELQPKRLVPSLVAGLVAGTVAILIEISFAALIFSGDLSAFVSNGIGFTLFGASLIGILIALFSSFPGMVALPQDVPAALLAVAAASIASQLPPSTPPQNLFANAVAAIVLTSLLTGIFTLILGTFNLGSLIRYIPYSVIGGFLAGTGWLLVRGGLGVITGLSLGSADLPALFQPAMLIKWAPGLVFAALLLFILRRFSHFLVIPTVVLGSIGLFYLVAWLAGLSFSEANAQGWLLGALPQGNLWRPVPWSAWRQVDWRLVVGQLGTMGTVAIVSALSVLLNASGIEVTARRDVDLNRELRATGIANIAASLVGSPAGYGALSLSVLGVRVGVSSRLVGILAAAMCGLVLFTGASFVSYFPKFVVGGLVIFLGLAFLVEWLFDAWFKLSKADYLIVVLIMLTMGIVGTLQGVGLGFILAVILFVVEYSRIDVVRHTLSGTNFHSNVERPRLYRELLRQKGNWLYILELQGFVFFGTANRLLEQVRHIVLNRQNLRAANHSSTRFIILDFRRVSGLDASAVLSFVKIKQLAQAQGLLLVFTHLSSRIQRQMEKEVLTAADQGCWRVEPDLDHGVEWCEEQIIQTLNEAGLAARTRSAKQELEVFLPHSKRIVSVLDLLVEEKAEVAEAAQAAAPSVENLAQYLERLDVEAGYVLIQQGEPTRGLYFIERGQVRVQTQAESGEVVRIRTTGPGTVIGEMGVYLGAPASATVVTNQPSTLFRLSAESLKQMEQDDPALSAAFHKFIAQLLSERLLSTTQMLQALMD